MRFENAKAWGAATAAMGWTDEEVAKDPKRAAALLRKMGATVRRLLAAENGITAEDLARSDARALAGPVEYEEPLDGAT